MFKSKKKERISDSAIEPTPIVGGQKDLTDGELAFIVANCGRPLYVCWVETLKDDSQDLFKRILAVGQYRLFQIKRSKVSSTKTVSKNIHYFQIKSLTCHDLKVAKIVYVKGDTHRTMEVRSHRIPDIIHAIRKAYRSISLGFLDTDAFALDVTEERSLKNLDQDYEPGPCCGFLETYRAWCDLLGQVPHGGLLRYMANKGKNDDKTIELREIPGIESPSTIALDFLAVMKSMSHNIHFTSFVSDGVVRKKIVDSIANIVSSNRALTRLVLRGLHASSSAWAGVFNGLMQHPSHRIQVLDLSFNKFEGQGFLTLLQALQSWPHSLHTLNMAKCSLGISQTTNLAVTLRSNFGMSLTLHSLDLSHNKLGEAGSDEVARWIDGMGASSSLEYLALKNADVHMVKLTVSLLALQHLRGLDVTGCKTGPDLSSMKELVVRTNSLNFLAFPGHAVGGKEISAPVLRHYLRNTKINGLTLRMTNLSDPMAITSALEQNKTLRTLDLTGCTFKEGELVILVLGLINCSALEVLVLDGCLQGHSFLANKFTSASDCRELGSALSTLVASNPNLHDLSLAGSFNKAVAAFLQPMGSNGSLKTLDISKNDIGDVGGQALADCVRSNQSLEHIKCDENGFSTNVWLELRTALDSTNRTLLSISYPWADMKKYQSGSLQHLLDRYKELADDVNRLLRSNQYQKLGREYEDDRKRDGMQLTFDSNFTPVELQPWAVVAGHQIAIQQQAQTTTLTVEPEPAATSPAKILATEGSEEADVDTKTGELSQSPEQSPKPTEQNAMDAEDESMFKPYDMSDDDSDEEQPPPLPPLDTKDSSQAL